jgi:hypothetical protein
LSGEGGIRTTRENLAKTAFSGEGGAKSGAPADAGELLALWAMLTDGQRAEVLALARRLANETYAQRDQRPLPTKGGGA